MTTILLVDDSKFTCSRTREMLVSIDASIKVDVAYLPSQAIELIKAPNAAYDLAIIDFNMPEMSGLELADNIRPFIPFENIVILTASSAFRTHSQSIPEGMHFCQKPVNEEKLREMLQFTQRKSA